jgi:hypothetical protein
MNEVNFTSPKLTGDIQRRRQRRHGEKSLKGGGSDSSKSAQYWSTGEDTQGPAENVVVYEEQ